MDIKILSIEIHNFKGFKDYRTSFNSHVTSIFGENGTGKTSIADAIFWCMFGKNTLNQQQFDIKHHDTIGNTEKRIEVSVSIDLQCNGTVHNITRKLKEKWTKERGTTNEILKGHATEYFVDNQPYTQGDFKAFMALIINEQVFRAITSPTYFTSLKWEEQRHFLSNMVGSITNEQIAAGDPRFNSLLQQLSQESITSILKGIRYRISECKDKLAQIPVSIAAMQKTMPELSEQPPYTKEELEKEIADINAQIIKIQSGNTADIKRAELNRKINFAQKRINEMQTSASNLASQELSTYNKAKSDFEDTLNENRRSLTRSKSTLADLNVSLERSYKHIEEINQQFASLRKQWNEQVNAPFVDLSESELNCPTCGQRLPEQNIEELRKRHRETFNLNKEQAEKTLTQKVKELKQDQADCLARQQTCKTDIAKCEADIKKYQNLIDTAKFDQQKPKSYADILAANPNYQAVNDEIKQLNEELENVTNDQADNDEKRSLNEDLARLNSLLDLIKSEEVKQAERKRISSLIAQEEQKRTDYAQRLADLEKEEDIARDFSNRADNVLEEMVNQHFQLVKWRMFRQNINGNREPYCECYVNGTAYHNGLNSAMAIWAGIDIINTLCKVYKANAPIIIDNAERCTSLPPTDSQLICLYVSSKDKTLSTLHSDNS